jgi:hypothetical protein
MASRARAILANSALTLVSLLAAVVLFELALRLIGFESPRFYVPDPYLGWRLKSGAEGLFTAEGRGEIRINSAGFRDREHLLAKPPNTFRIAVLGDSYAEALQVEIENTFWSRLQEALRSCPGLKGREVEVLNFGVSGYGTAQELLTFRRYVRPYQPDLVLLAFYSGNDVRNNSRRLESEKTRPFFVLHGDQLVEDDSFASSDEYNRRTRWFRKVLDELNFLRIVQAAYFAKDRLLAQRASPAASRAGEGAELGLDDRVYTEPTTEPWRGAWAVTEKLLAALNREVRESGSNLLVATVSSGAQVNPDPAFRRKFMARVGATDLFYPDRRAARVAKEAGADSIVLGPQLLAQAEAKKVYLHGFPNTSLGSGHWNEEGHLLAARILAEHICSGMSP